MLSVVAILTLAYEKTASLVFLLMRACCMRFVTASRVHPTCMIVEPSKMSGLEVAKLGAFYSYWREVAAPYSTHTHTQTEKTDRTKDTSPT